jgi:hypothetical protein
MIDQKAKADKHLFFKKTMKKNSRLKVKTALGKSAKLHF